MFWSGLLLAVLEFSIATDVPESEGWKQHRFHTVAEFFLFQAADGIRVYKVTGVQTCALPISWRRGPCPLRHARVRGNGCHVMGHRRDTDFPSLGRGEEGRGHDATRVAECQRVSGRRDD